MSIEELLMDWALRHLEEVHAEDERRGGYENCWTLTARPPSPQVEGN